jgi:hypothetical protein
VLHNGRCLRFVPPERLADLAPAAARRDAEAIAELRGHLPPGLLRGLARELLREHARAALPLRTRAAVLLHEVSGGLWERPLQPLRGSAGESYRRAFRTAVHEGDAALVRHVLRQRPGRSGLFTVFFLTLRRPSARS